MEIRCCSPPERVEPFSPITIWQPWGSLRINSSHWAAQADVLHHRVQEQHHVLEHHGVGAQEGLRVHRGHVRSA